MIFPVAGVFFWVSLFGDGAMFSDVEDHPSPDQVFCSGVADCLVACSSLFIIFSSVRQSMSHAGVLSGLLPVFFLFG